MQRRLFVAVLMLVVAGCDLESGAGNAPVLNSPAALEVLGGDKQVGQAGTALPAGIIVRVKDTRQEPIVGVNVHFEVTVGEGSVSAATVKTDSEGTAQVDWTLGPDVGTQELEARVIHASSGVVLLTAKITATAQ